MDNRMIPPQEVMEAQLRQIAIVHALELIKAMGENQHPDINKLITNAKKIEEYIKGEVA